MAKRSAKDKALSVSLAFLIAAFYALEIILRPKKENGGKNERPIQNS
jgi:hypothetical protein